MTAYNGADDCDNRPDDWAPGELIEDGYDGAVWADHGGVCDRSQVDELVPADGEEGVEYTSDTARLERW